MTDADVKKLNQTYNERNTLMIALARTMLLLGHKAGYGVDLPKLEMGWTEDWATVVYIDLPDGKQLSYHMNEFTAEAARTLPLYPGKWDGSFVGREVPDWLISLHDLRTSEAELALAEAVINANRPQRDDLDQLVRARLEGVDSELRKLPPYEVIQAADKVANWAADNNWGDAWAIGKVCSRAMARYNPPDTGSDPSMYIGGKAEDMGRQLNLAATRTQPFKERVLNLESTPQYTNLIHNSAGQLHVDPRIDPHANDLGEPWAPVKSFGTLGSFKIMSPAEVNAGMTFIDAAPSASDDIEMPPGAHRIQCACQPGSSCFQRADGTIACDDEKAPAVISEVDQLETVLTSAAMAMADHAIYHYRIKGTIAETLCRSTDDCELFIGKAGAAVNCMTCLRIREQMKGAQ